MKRRGFFAALLAAPFMPYAAKSAKAAKAPFVFESGVLYLNEVKANSLSALSAELGNVEITECCCISPLTVGASNIEGYCTGYRVHDPEAKRASILMDVPEGEYPKPIKMSDLVSLGKGHQRG